jgi:4-amino-4-deoxy-L-arabinose transferase-like glycosyltransferase
MARFFKQFRALAPADTAWLALVFIAIAVYLYGLGSPYAPTNGDEMVYIHIARMTAESGHWLPLQSELIDTRNTKPPLLIWQAMAAGGWGQQWSLWFLRLPSILYTFATTALLAFFAYRLADVRLGKLRTACLAATLYLLFFSTFRYGRVYLTSAPETFWLALPMWWVLWLRVRTTEMPPSSTVTATLAATAATRAPAHAPVAVASERHTLLGWWAYTLFGVALGLGSAYKSFALVAPATAAVWCAVLLSEPKFQWRSTVQTTLGLAWSALLGVGIFALWFVLDPDPAAVWQEFVVAENAGKMSGGQGYWHAALYGAYPMWTQLLAYPANAGLLALPVLGLCGLALFQAFRRTVYAQLPPAQWVLLAWLVVWLVVFTIPSQRSERYVIPAMPALAIAMALVWDRLPRIWFWLTLLVIPPALVLLARIGWVMGEMEIASSTEVALVLIAACAGFTGAAASFCAKSFGLAHHKDWSRNAALVGCLAVYATFSLMVAPLSQPKIHYSPAVQAHMQGQRIAVPNGFTGQYERFHFVLPGARITPYDAEGRNTGALYPTMAPAQRLDTLLKEFDAVVWLQDDLQDTAPSCVPRCKVLAQRWHVKSRHKTGEVTWGNFWMPQEWLFRREWLVVKG